jgi:hypothetical protein
MPVRLQKHFAGDVDCTIRTIQERTFEDSIECLYACARAEYLSIIESSEMRDEKLVQAVERTKTFDHDILLPAYDRIAACFRFKNTDIWQTSLFPAGSDDSLSRREEAERDWVRFFRRECEAIAQTGETARAVLNAVGFAGEDRGEDALQALLCLLDGRYKALTNARNRWGEFREMREFCDW